MVIKKDFNWTDIEILIKIKNISNKNEITISEIAKKINISRFHPNFTKIIKYLLENNIITVERVFGNVKVLKMNYKKICELIDEQNLIINLADNYLKKDHVYTL